jgi:high-affinity iron transporter
MARALIAALVVLAVVPAAAAGAPPATDAAALLTGLPASYRQAVIAHDGASAAQLRARATLLARARPTAATRRLARALAGTENPLRPWPTAATVAALAEAAGRGLPAPPAAGRDYDAVRAALDATPDLSRALHAYALSSALRSASPGLEAAFAELLGTLARDAPPAQVADAGRRAGAAVTTTQQALGDVRISRGTVVTDAAILVFREGLEAVLILAAITASFTGARRALRRPVLLGGVAGIAATAVTWVLAQLVIRELGTGGMRLEAVTGLLAIAVLLLVTNWFFHRVYWSQWIARFNRRRKSLERLDRLGFVSGQALALTLLGLTSVYREGFETVLFLQNLHVSAGTGACLLGAGIGLAATLAVGAITFLAQRKLPYKRMLIATGVLIAVVLAVMTGTTAHVMQGLGWLPATPTGFSLPVWANSWLGLYATWEGLAAQFGALVVVLGSYVVAREVQVRGPRRRARRRAAVEPTT